MNLIIWVLNDLFIITLSLCSYAIEFIRLACELRFVISWFLAINPYVEPMFTLWSFTNFIFTGNRRNYPRVFGVDVTAGINLRILGALQKTLDTYIDSPFIKQGGFKPFEAGEFRNDDSNNYNFDYSSEILIALNHISS